MNTKKWLWLPLMLLCTFWFLLLLGYAPLVIQDEGRYVGIAREMLVSHDWVVPWLNGVPFFDKPILYYWMEMIALKLGGVSEFAARLPQALLGASGVMMLYHTCKRLFNWRVGVFAALTLAVMPLYFLLAHYADMDLEVAVFIGLSLMNLLLAQQPDASSKQNRFYMWACFAAAGCAVLTKGFMGLVFPIMVSTLWMLWTRYWPGFKRLHLLSGLLIVLTINAPWDIIMQLRFPDYWHYFFYQLQFARYFSHSFSHLEPFWFYIPVLIVGALPVSLLGLSALFNWRCLTMDYVKAHANQTFFLVWFVSIYLFFSVAHTKLIGYMIPVMPAIAALAALRFEHWWRERSRVPLIAGCITVIGLAVFAAVFALAPHFYPDLAKSGSNAHAHAIAVVYALAAVVALVAWIKQRVRWMIVASLLAVAMMNVIVLVCPALQRTNKKLYLEASRYITPDTLVVMHNTYLYDASFYLQRSSLMVNKWQTPMAVFGDSWIWRMQYGRIQAPESANRWMIEEDKFQQLWHSDKPMVVFVDKRMFTDFKNSVEPKPVVASDHYGFMALIKPSMQKATAH